MLRVFLLLTFTTVSTWAYDINPKTCELIPQRHWFAISGQFLFIRFPLIPYFITESSPFLIGSKNENCLKIKSLTEVNTICDQGEFNTDAEVALKGRFCFSNIAQKKQDLLSANFDVPAKIINQWSAQYMQEKWNLWQKQQEELAQGAALYLPNKSDRDAKIHDYDLLLELNKSAFNLWQEMLTCAEGDAEKARENYKTANWPCTEIKSNLKELRTNVVNYFQTANLFKIDLTDELKAGYGKMISRWELQELTYKVMEKIQRGETINKPIPRAPSLHPLFVQISFEELMAANDQAKNYNIEQLGKALMKNSGFTSPKEVANESNQEKAIKYFNNVNQLFMLFPDPAPECNTYGLWPAAGRAVQKDLQILAFKRTGVKVVNFGAVPESCNVNKLPQIYEDNFEWLTKEYLKIRERYL